MQNCKIIIDHSSLLQSILLDMINDELKAYESAKVNSVKSEGVRKCSSMPGFRKVKDCFDRIFYVKKENVQGYSFENEENVFLLKASDLELLEKYVPSENTGKYRIKDLAAIQFAKVIPSGRICVTPAELQANKEPYCYLINRKLLRDEKGLPFIGDLSAFFWTFWAHRDIYIKTPSVYGTWEDRVYEDILVDDSEEAQKKLVNIVRDGAVRRECLVEANTGNILRRAICRYDEEELFSVIGNIGGKIVA